MIAWIDLETTGLNELCSVIEAACVITDDSFNEKEHYSTVLRLDRMALCEKGAMEMHMENGLWDEAKSEKAIGVAFVDQEIEYLISKYENPIILGGQSVHFDRKFIDKYFPRTARRLSHRHFDVSVLKLFHHYNSGKHPENLPPFKSTTTHRALDDIRASIEAAKWYRDNTWKDNT